MDKITAKEKLMDKLFRKTINNKGQIIKMVEEALEEAYERGYSKGYDDGKDIGYDNGWEAGYGTARE